ncbi:hypothetical protein XAUC_43820 [Xanthomonas citri pv. aurantifolii str. ICPB 10535]|nr:hypothetical protein XAUC_43820 [Xanthomonas citri pv. aurantifolii str. ICPB 10535]
MRNIPTTRLPRTFYHGFPGAITRNAVIIRHVGDYALTAHAAAMGSQFFPEILVSRSGGLTLHCYQLPSSGFATYAEAVAYARKELDSCGVSSTGVLLTGIGSPGVAAPLH